MSVTRILTADPEPQTFPYDLLAWQGSDKLARETVHLPRSLLTGIPDTRPALKRFCAARGLTPPQVPIHLRADRVRWVIPIDAVRTKDATAHAIIVEFRAPAE